MGGVRLIGELWAYGLVVVDISFKSLHKPKLGSEIFSSLIRGFRENRDMDFGELQLGRRFVVSTAMDLHICLSSLDYEILMSYERRDWKANMNYNDFRKCELILSWFGNLQIHILNFLFRSMAFMRQTWSSWKLYKSDSFLTSSVTVPFENKK